MVSGINKYKSILVISFKNYMVHTKEVILRSSFYVLILYVFVNLWKYTYGDTNKIDGVEFTLSQMLWYLVITESIVISRTKLNKVIEDDIRSGNICYVLVKPYSYILMSLSKAFSERLIRLTVNITIGCVIMYLFNEKISFQIIHIILSVVVILLAITIDMLFSICFGLFSFWIENAIPLYFVFTRIQMILGGVLIPISIFPGIINSISMILPFRYMIYEPAKLFVSFDYQRYYSIFAGQIAYIVSIGIIAYFIFYGGRCRLNVNGG